MLQSDRLCHRCGFNLIGQPVVREDRLGMCVVRCPHCRQVAALDEYPPLGHWLNRWAMLAAALWLLLITAFALGSLLLTGGLTIGFVIESTYRYESRISEAYRDWLEERTPDRADRFFWNDEQFRVFWDEQGPIVLTDPGLSRASIEWEELSLLLIPACIAFLAGCFLSVALLQWSRRRLVLGQWLIVGPLLLAAGAVWLWLARMPFTSAPHVAWVRMYLPVLALVLPSVMLILSIGLVTGRPIARGLVRALLPPRLRGALAILWTAEGRRVPGPPACTLRRLRDDGSGEGKR
jgi:hypothetical protein